MGGIEREGMVALLREEHNDGDIHITDGAGSTVLTKIIEP